MNGESLFIKNRNLNYIINNNYMIKMYKNNQYIKLEQ
jgi:hypothetical protein